MLCVTFQCVHVALTYKDLGPLALQESSGQIPTQPGPEKAAACAAEALAAIPRPDPGSVPALEQGPTANTQALAAAAQEVHASAQISTQPGPEKDPASTSTTVATAKPEVQVSAQIPTQPGPEKEVTSSLIPDTMVETPADSHPFHRRPDSASTMQLGASREDLLVSPAKGAQALQENIAKLMQQYKEVTGNAYVSPEARSLYACAYSYMIAHDHVQSVSGRWGKQPSHRAAHG